MAGQATSREIERQKKLANVAYQTNETERSNHELAKYNKRLLEILPFGVRNPFIFNDHGIGLLMGVEPFNPPANLLTETKKPGFFENLFSNGKKKYEENETKRLSELSRLLKEYDEKSAKIKNRITGMRYKYVLGEPDGVADYIAMILEQSEYPPEIRNIFKLAYVPESKEIVIEQELPGLSVIPTVAEYRYVKTKDLIEPKNRRELEIKDSYSDLLSSICLRVIFEIISADDQNHVEVVTFNGYVRTIDLATGKDIQPYLISVRTTRTVFKEINLLRVDKKVCLRNLGAHVSQRPGEMQPVKPIVNFDMVDKRFVEQSDILKELDTRQNLMELNPFEFENLVSNLFTKMGLDTKQTRSSKDGGVDAVAYDQRPVLGGKVVIQAKRYKDTVGVAAVRDLYGTMMNEGANKGILVTTSGYGPDAYEFSKDKPIELIDGGGLIYLLNQVGIEAKIVNVDV